MFESNNPPLVSSAIKDLGVPGVTVAVDPDEATRLGAFAEDAIEESDATGATS